MEKVLSRFLDEYSIVSDNFSPLDGTTGKDEDDDNLTNPKSKLVMDQVHVQTVAQFILNVKMIRLFMLKIITVILQSH